MKLFRVLALGAFVALVCASPAIAALNSWTVTGPYGGRTSVVAYHPTQPGVVLVSTMAGVFRSTDGGVNFSATIGSPRVTAESLRFDPQDPNYVYAVNNSIYRSTDAGRTFSLMAGVPTSAVRELDVGPDGQIFISDSNGEVFRSSNRGQSWTATARPWPLSPGSIDLTALTVDPNNASTVYVGFQGRGIYKSINSGDSWTPPPTGPGNGTYTINTIDVKRGDSTRVLVAANDGVWRSTDGGASFTRITFVNSWWLAINPDVANTDEVISVDFEGSIIRSMDGGATFPFTGARVKRRGTMRFAFDPLQPARVMIATDDGPLLSIDDADNFGLIQRPIHAEFDGRFAAADDGTIYATFRGGPHTVSRRTALGWESLDDTSLRSQSFLAPWTTGIAVAPSDSDVVWVSAIDDYLLKSTDGAATWGPPSPQFTGRGWLITAIVVDPADANVVYVTTEQQGVWRTANGGTSWTQRATGIPAHVSALAVDRATPAVLYAGGGASTGGVWKSLNSGITWAATGTLPAEGVLGIVIDPSNSAIVYALTQGHVFRSTNGGTSWTAIDFGDALGAQTIWPRGLFIDPVMPTAIMVGVSNGVLRSVDSGATWESIPWPPDYRDGYQLTSLIVDPLRPGSLITSGHATGVLEYEVAPDLGISFEGTVSDLDPLAVETTRNAAVTVRNSGPNASAGSVASVTLPGWLDVAVPAGCSRAGQTLTCPVGPLRRNQIATIPLALTVGATPSTGQITARVVPHDEDPTLPNQQIIALTSTLQTAFELELAPSTATVVHGSRMTLVVSARNLGPSPANQVQIVLPMGGFEHVAVNDAHGGFCSVNHGATIITCTYQRLLPGAEAGFSVRMDAITIGTQDFVATMTGAGGSVSATTRVVTRPLVDFVSAVTGPAGPMTVGETFPYTITVRNDGPDAAGVGILVGFDLVNTAAVTATNATCQRFTASLECVATSLAPGATATIVADVIGGLGGTAGARVTLTSGAADSNAANDAATVTTAIRLVGDVGVTLAESVDPATTNVAYRYTALATNAGPNEVSVRLNLPVTGASVTAAIFGGNSTNNTGICQINAGSTAECAFVLAAGARKEVLVDVTAVSAGTVTANATVSLVTGFDSNAGNDSAAITTTVNAPPPASSSSSSSSSGGGGSSSGGGGGGGGSLDWLAALGLAGLLGLRLRRRMP